MFSLDSFKQFYNHCFVICVETNHKITKYGRFSMHSFNLFTFILIQLQNCLIRHQCILFLAGLGHELFYFYIGFQFD